MSSFLRCVIDANICIKQFIADPFFTVPKTQKPGFFRASLSPNLLIETRFLWFIALFA